MESHVLHKRLVALLAGMLCAVAVVAVTFLVLPAQKTADPSVECGYVYSGPKSSSIDFIHANLTDDSLVMLGSSEFSTPASSVPQIPAQVFGTHNYGLRAMLVGEAFDQCLWDAVALGALANNGLPRNKVVITVGLGQFTDGGLDNSSFGTRFSYTLYKGFCKNDRVPGDVAAYVRKRLVEQGIDETTLRAAEAASPLDAINGLVIGGMDDLKLRSELIGVRNKGVPLVTTPAEQPDWPALRAAALEDAQRMSTTNDWGAEDDFWNEQLAPALPKLEGARAGETYTDTPEYDDLDCFLTLCEALNIEPLLVVSPSMGPYYDYIGIPASAREVAYQHIRDVAAAHPTTKLADFSDREYEKYFLFDIVHFGWTGWIDVEEAIYRFAMGEA